MIYLDSAATSLLKPASVERAVVQAMRTAASPGRGGHAPAQKAAETVFSCREAASELFQVPDPSCVVFTMNATHGLNLAIRSLVKEGTHVLVSGYEHNAVMRPLYAAKAEIRKVCTALFYPERFLEEWEAALPWAQAAVCTHVSNVFGYILPIDEIASLCRQKGIPLIVDASQSAGILPVSFHRLGVSYIAMPGHKGLLGPQGTGLLLCGERGIPLLYGGSGSESRLHTMPESLPERLEAGTHNVCGIAGLLAGIRYILGKGTEAICREEHEQLSTALQMLRGSRAEIFSRDGRFQSGVLSLRAPGTDVEELAERLAQRDVCVRAGLHCAPLAHESAGTLETGTLRLSFSPFLAREALKSAVSILAEEINRA